ncbi:substrate-binding domain-containing protein [Haloarcula sp. 1CSR25-25]|uniref:substrate-binding domain-containing protein n=1 Tax=Haloarcula sp. 1CSR25-25 TaxID=2862545 RepID=UPI002895B6DF|nr:substrate-binding domain-containing protein [Haloarcula sp. 1CSR25-25]MDT3436013.1 substrate-binding domain-containing protein [Haloarcula sp. 1CSR25-25]
MAHPIRRRRFIRSSALAGTALLAGCGGSGGDGGDGGDGGGESGGDGGTTTTDNGMETTTSGPPSAALSVPSLEFTFFARMQNAFDQAQSDGLIASDSSFYDAGNNQSQQVSDVETAISNEVDFLMISAITAEGVINAISQANEAGIPVVAIDRNVAEGETVTYVASDNVQLGRRSTELCLQFMQSAGDQDTYNVVQLEGTPGASVTNDRGEGFSNAVDNNDSLSRLASQTGEFSTQNALNVMEDFITQYGDEIDGVFCQNDLMALGAHRALQNADMSVPVTGIDGTEAWVELFADNGSYGTLAQLPEEMVTTAIEQATAHMAGEDVEDTITIEGLEVTQDNASDYLGQYFG